VSRSLNHGAQRGSGASMMKIVGRDGKARVRNDGMGHAQRRQLYMRNR
jgi:hypothetical protein